MFFEPDKEDFQRLTNREVGFGKTDWERPVQDISETMNLLCTICNISGCNVNLDKYYFFSLLVIFTWLRPDIFEL